MTSIEWLWEQIPFEFTSKRSAFEVFEQAKEIHKQEIIQCCHDNFTACCSNELSTKSAESYYNCVFKKD
jgi:hypothetical protein